MISIKYAGRFGNNLFQMSAASLLAKKFNQYIENPLDSIIKHENRPDETAHFGSIEVNNSNILDIYNSNTIDTNIVLNDYFQTKEIANLAYRNNTYIQDGPYIEDLIFIHIRLGDVNGSFSLDYNYYKNALNLLPAKKIVISTDSPGDELIQRLMGDFGAVLFKETPQNTILFASSCQYKILSSGTFSWWIGFLGEYFHRDKHNRITICPSMSRFTRAWHGDIFPMFDWVVF